MTQAGQSGPGRGVCGGSLILPGVAESGERVSHRIAGRSAAAHLDAITRYRAAVADLL